VRGVRFGRPSQYNESVKTAVRELRTRGAGIREIAAQLQIGCVTVYKALDVASSNEYLERPSSLMASVAPRVLWLANGCRHNFYSKNLTQRTVTASMIDAVYRVDHDGITLLKNRSTYQRLLYDAAIVNAGKTVLLVRNTNVLPGSGSLKRIRRNCSG